MPYPNVKTSTGEYFGETVLCHIWASGINPEKRGETVGHASLEILIDGIRGTKTKNTYMSASPDLGLGREFQKIDALFTHPVKFSESYMEDIDLNGNFEQRDADFTFVFQTLDRLKIEEAMEEMFAQETNWSITSKSCVAVVYKLLLVGDFKYLIKDVSKIKSIVDTSNVASKATSDAPADELPTALIGSGIYTAETVLGVININSPDYLILLLKEAKQKENEIIRRGTNQQVNENYESLEVLQFEDNTLRNEWIPLMNPEPISYKPLIMTFSIIAILIAVWYNFWW